MREGGTKGVAWGRQRVRERGRVRGELCRSTLILCVQVGDELLEINGNSTEGMRRSDAVSVIKHGGDVVKLIIRRIPHEAFIAREFIRT